ncbi:MAG: penicillin acylase family protein, partial [Cyclobacteriaceae bacterium]|nr:penicillin acylase family protein [Cyclobacteriaceae bacterium]
RLLDRDIIELYEAFRKPVSFAPGDLATASNTDLRAYEDLARQDESDYQQLMNRDRFSIGSNNWIVSATKSVSGFPLLANDPHRAIAAPSLRYMVHLNAPGWNVLGGGEPTIPGVSIGHNDYGAWGLTIFAIDIEDLYVYELNPENPLQYKYKGQWETMTSIPDTIHVKGAPDVIVNHLFTRHGPVTKQDGENHIAYAVRAAWREAGGAPYLASLRMDQATSWEEFQIACSYSRLPGENMIWADQKGNIGWQAVGIAPIRRNWSGLVPVPGDGRFEWDGFLPINDLPHEYNPTKGFFATANENNVPDDYVHRNAVGWEWADRYRSDRIHEVLSADKKFTLDDMKKLQFDYMSLPSRSLLPLLEKITFDRPLVAQARRRLLMWNQVVDQNSIDAAVYVAWERKLVEMMTVKKVPEAIRSYVTSVPLSKVVDWLVSGKVEESEVLIRESFIAAVDGLKTKFGGDMNRWLYGQAGFHHSLIKHPLSNAVNEATRKKLECGPVPRSGYGATPGMTSNNDNQTSGASFRMVVDLKDWDSAQFTNTPGQSGDPSSRFYRNLFPLWATDTHFPVYFSRKKIESTAAERWKINPSN